MSDVDGIKISDNDSGRGKTTTRFSARKNPVNYTQIMRDYQCGLKEICDSNYRNEYLSDHSFMKIEIEKISEPYIVYLK